MPSFKKCIFFLLILICNLHLSSQEEVPIWDIGTKWTYTIFANFSETSSEDGVGYLTNEIIDTATIDGFKLYEVESFPFLSNIKYFHYQGSKVYNYDPETTILQLLYDFEETEGYTVDYRPVCDPDFNYDSLFTQPYSITIDSITDMTIANGDVLSVQHTRDVTDRYEIIKNVGFSRGKQRSTHDWHIGDFVCTSFSNLVWKLRCFESESEFYQFVDFPCDYIDTSTAVNTADLEVLSRIEVYPNPTTGEIRISSDSEPIQYNLYNNQGVLYKTGQYNGGSLELEQNGVNVLQLIQGDQTKVFKVIKTD